MCVYVCVYIYMCVNNMLRMTVGTKLLHKM
jgi:hypothetical protein